MEENLLIQDSQHGVACGRLCLTNLIEFFEEVVKVIDEGRMVDVVYMDFSKAIDKATHGGLSRRLRLTLTVTWSCGFRTALLV